ncbi:TAFII55 protein conserved region-domain-containing protein [Jackrogersella minutella]|nr:TAFII55 protein conserved region-domain-containing protein [Jackrogersella minutella]
MSSINVKPSLKLDTTQKMPPPSNTETPNPKPILKLNTGSRSRQASFSGDVGTPTPSGDGKKIKIKLNSQPGTPAATSAAPTPTVTKSKAGRTSKPTAKLIESKKRGYESDEDRPLSLTRQESEQPNKKIKIKPTSKGSANPHTVNTPISSIKFKPKGEPIQHRPGDGYDSEASDREVDPIRESTFLLRVMPGAPTEYLKKALADGTVGIPKQNGGADFSVQFLDAKQRRAMVSINGAHFAAVLVHLPTITEATKSWDRKNMLKNSDLTEMLLCFQEVSNEIEAKTAPLPPMVLNNDHKWPHGLTPPMHDAVHRRFRKVLSEKQWQTSAQKVAKLLEDDEAALASQVEFLQDEDGDISSDDEVDAEGDIEQDYFRDPNDDMEGVPEDDEMIAAMEAELTKNESLHDEPITATPAMSLEAPTPIMETEAPTPMTVGVNTPAPVAEEASSEEESEEDEEDDDDDDDEDDEDRDEVDEEQLVAERERKEKLDEIDHLEKSYQDTLRQLTEVTMPILKRRILQTKSNLEKEIAVKKAALGLTDED